MTGAGQGWYPSKKVREGRQPFPPAAATERWNTDSTGPTERMGMRGTRHAAPQSRRERGRGVITGVPAALLAIGVLVCNPVALLEVRTAGGWRRLPRTDYNYFVSSDGSGCGGPIRIADIYGQHLTVTGIALRPNVAQPTGVQFARH